MIQAFRRCVASLLIVCLAGLGLPAQAGMLPTESTPGADARGEVTRLLARDEVRSQLEAFGVNAAQVEARIAAMTDEEVAQLAGKIDQLPAGGDVLGVLLTIFIVLLITDILGFTKIFPFTRSIR